MNYNRIYRSLAAMMLLVATASCAIMQDDRDKCPTCKNPLRVLLKYDYNLLRADMFSDHVGAATCYVVNDQNIIVAKQQTANTPSAQPLRDRAFGFNFEELMPGRYTVYAVGAQRSFNQLASFVPTELNEGDDIRQLRLSIDHSGNNVPPRALDTIWHGISTTIDLPEKQGVETTVGLMRDTKNLNIMLLQTDNPTDNDADNYDVSITDNNGLLNYDNSQVESEPTLVYRPYAAWTTETLEEEQTRAPGDVVQRTAHFDLSFGRLFSHADATKNARLIINNRQTGENIVNIDLPYYLSLVRTAAENVYGVQEFLDRGYDYHLDIFLKGNEWQYMNINILVTGWSLRVYNAQL